MQRKFEINQKKIKGGCQPGRKVVTYNSKSDLPLDCMDTYERLTCKILAMMTWASQLKTKKNLDISWLIKADDDIAINAQLLAENLLTLNPSQDQIYCHVRWFPAPNRKGGSKW